MSFLSYRTRIPRHFDSHANVRSTTHRRGLWPCDRSQPFFSSPIRRMCGVYPAAVAAPSPVGLSYALSRACAAAHPLSVRAARPRYSRSSLPGASVPARSPRRSPPPAVHRRHRSPGSFWCPFFLGRWDSCPSFSPPKRALPSIASAGCHSHCTPPSSSHSATKTAQIRSKIPPQPSAERVVDSALGSVPLGQLVPLAAAVHPEDDRIQHFPPIGDLPPSRFLGPEFQEDRLDPPPQLVGDFPDRTQRFASRLPADHGSVSCRYARKWSLLATSSFLQKVFRRFSDSY